MFKWQVQEGFMLDNSIIVSLVIEYHAMIKHLGIACIL
jgi:hypothetical protein